MERQSRAKRKRRQLQELHRSAFLLNNDDYDDDSSSGEESDGGGEATPTGESELTVRHGNVRPPSRGSYDFSAPRQTTIVEGGEEWRRKSVDTSGISSGFTDIAKQNRRRRRMMAEISPSTAELHDSSSNDYGRNVMVNRNSDCDMAGEVRFDSRNVKVSLGNLISDYADTKRFQRQRSSIFPQRFHFPSSYFSDGKRRIDFVLVYEPDSENEVVDEDEGPITERSDSPMKHRERRRVFENNLKRIGLELEHASAVHSNTRFVLIHAPFKVLLKQAEVLNIKMPIRQNDIKKHANIMDGAVNAFLKRFRFLDFDEKIKRRIEPVDYFTQPFIEQHLECFVNYESEDEFFSTSDRIRMVHDYLIRARYNDGTKEKYRFGIDRLIQNGTYTAAYPLHEELFSDSNLDYDECSNRQLLYETWVKMKNVWKYQPLHLIQDYFGTKVGFYFAWLGYYTRSLYIVSVLGVLCVLYGLFTMSTDVPTNDICGSYKIGSTAYICPNCDKYCDFTPLNSSCTYAKLTYMFDNVSTIIFAVIMSVWSTFFLEFWKRYSAELAYKWNVLDYEKEQEVMRPEFQFLKGRTRTNPVTGQKEPYLPFFHRLLRFSGSAVVVLFFLCLVVALVIGIVAYRVIVMHVFYTMDNNNFIQSQAVLVTSMTAALLNLIFILLMNYVYDILALKLTDMECHRTQTEYDNSYTLKMFFFQFINYYSSLFYIAFIKGRFSGIPDYTEKGESHDNSTAGITGIRILGQRLEDCDPAGCMVELVIQLFIVMCGKQIFFFVIGHPVLIYWIRNWRLPFSMIQRRSTLVQQMVKSGDAGGNSTTFIDKSKKKARDHRSTNNALVNLEAQLADITADNTPLYERDNLLTPVTQQFLFNEYLEMVIQFGFITLFVAAFPLAPLFALLNNIFEIRLDAYKFVVNTRRPIPAQARNIGIWMTILDLLSNVAVLCNAFVIAFTSDFIPKAYYYFINYTIVDYVDDSLSYFDASNLNIAYPSFPNVTVCRYRDYRKPPCHLKLDGIRHTHGDCDDNYSLQDRWWIILSLRLIFVLVFELLVLSIKAIFAYVIPDMPSKITLQLQREKYLTRQAILQRSDNLSPQRVCSPQECTSDDVNSSLQRSNDVDMVAYQPNEDLVGNDTVNGNVAEKERPIRRVETDQPTGNNIHRMFSNRQRPSLSPSSSQMELNKHNYDSADGNRFTSTSSLSPLSALSLANSGEGGCDNKEKERSPSLTTVQHHFMPNDSSAEAILDANDKAVGNGSTVRNSPDSFYSAQAQTPSPLLRRPARAGK